MPYDNPYNGQNPLISPLLKAWQLYSIAQDNKRQQQAMEMQRQQFEAAQQQRQLDNQYRQASFDYNKGQDEYQRKQTEEANKYNRSLNAMKTTRELADLGARAGNPAVEQSLTQLFGSPQNPRPALQTPEGQTYYLPTQNEQLGKQYQNLINMGKLDAANDLYKMQLLFPYQSAMKQGAVQPHVFQATDASGNLNYMGINPITGQQVYSGSQSGFGAPKGSAKAKQPTQSDFDRFEDYKRKALESYREAEIQQATGDDKSVKKAALLRAQGKSLFEQAHAAGTALQQQYPDMVEYGQDAQGYPYVKRKQ